MENRPPMQKTPRYRRVFGADGWLRPLLVRTAGVLVTLALLVWIAAFVGNLLWISPLKTGRFADASAFRGPDFAQIYPGSTPAAPQPDQPELAPDPATFTWAQPQKTYAFVNMWPLYSFDSYRRHQNAVDTVFPDWLALNPAGDALMQVDSERQAVMAAYFAGSAPQTGLLPVVDGMARGLGESQRGALVADMLARTQSGGFDGLCLDLTEIPAAQTGKAVDLLAAVQGAFAPSGKQLCVILDAGVRDWPLERINPLVDLVVAVPFDRPGAGDIPAPVAPIGRMEQLRRDLARIDPGKRVLALANFGADWISGQPRPAFIPFAEVLRRAALNNAPIRFESASLTPFTGYVGQDGRHQIFFTDATTAYNQLRALDGMALNGAAIWPLGGEDDSLWRLLSPDSAAPAVLLQDVDTSAYVGVEGQGGFFTVLGQPQKGRRRIQTGPAQGLITAVQYAPLPQGYSVAYWGADMRNRIAITFDDGPDARYTPQMLDILAREKVPAAFFMIGERALEAPEVVQQVLDAGQTIGVHTFTHPNIGMISQSRLAIEANATQRLLSGITGRNTILFRAPYGEDSEPSTPEQAAPIALLTREGYINVGMQIDPHDWHRPGVPEIVARVHKEALETGGGILLLHDGGGDRAQTLAALPLIIADLRASGFTFASLADFLETDAATLMPPVQPDPDLPLPVNRFDMASFTLGQWGMAFLRYAFAGALVLGVGRSLLIVVFALLRRRPHRDGHRPDVTVLVPAYNEETVILHTLAAVLASDYPRLRVIVIDDGSDDKTYDLVRSAYKTDPRVRVLHQENAGKAAALNTGVAAAETEILVAIDADTIILPDAIGALVAHFADPDVGAVAGNAKVGNRVNLLTRLQAVEYITSQNLDRRAFERPNAILVVPGAIGAWRRTALLAAGGYSLRTLAEDADMTVSVIRQGYRVIYEENAIAMTEAPETLRQLMNQRLRWTLGILQVAWANRGALREGNGIGLVALPNVAVFGTLLPLLAPFADVVFLLALWRVVRDAIQHPTMVWADFSPVVFALYAVYLLSDVALSAVAFLMEPEEDKRLLLRVPLQRFFYRQILYVAVLRSLWRAMTGRLSGWRKVTRTADVALPAPRHSCREVNLCYITPNRPDSLSPSAPPPLPDSRGAGS